MIQDCIAAVATAPAQAAISVLRLSGPGSIEIAKRVFRLQHPGNSKPRQARLAEAIAASGEVLDQGLLIAFVAPASYTGEDVFEFHGHGGMLVTQKVLQTVLEAGARLASPGEFTQRAFINGKMDLTQAEAVMDLIEAQSSLALRAAREQLSGTLGRSIEALRQHLLPTLAHIEAYIDFPEEDISPDTGAAMRQRIEQTAALGSKLLATSEQGRILRQGARTVICGQPNAGKSSLLNLLLGCERAIVSERPGTTRDTIEEIIQIQGIPLRLVDTAGLRSDLSDPIEAEGMNRSRREIQRADLILEVVDASQAPAARTELDLPQDNRARHLLILNKADLGLHPDWQGHAGLPMSCTQAQGLPELQQAIGQLLTEGSGLLDEHPIAINTRHQACLKRMNGHLAQALQSLQQGQPPEILALDLREALGALDEITGRTDVEEILDVLFSSFCIGK
jgi:tRNA modification GTPase